MTAEWSEIFPDWVTPELALDDWRRRIDRVAAEEGEHFASLPYVRGLAVIGSVGRGDPWPWSDVDMLAVADARQGTVAHEPLAQSQGLENRYRHLRPDSVGTPEPVPIFEADPEDLLRDVLWAIRRGAGEAVDELAATRDLLNIALLHPVVSDDSRAPRPAWTGVTNDELAARAQFEAAEEMLRRLRAAKTRLKGHK